MFLWPFFLKYLAWFRLVLRHFNHCRQFNAKSWLYIYIYNFLAHIVVNILKWAATLLYTVKWFRLSPGSVSSSLLNRSKFLIHFIIFKIPLFLFSKISALVFLLPTLFWQGLHNCVKVVFMREKTGKSFCWKGNTKWYQIKK